MGASSRAVQRALAGQRRGQVTLARHYPQQRIVAQLFVVVQVFVAQRQTDHALRDHLPQRVLNQRRIPPVDEALGEAAQQIDAAVHLAQQQHAAVAGQPVGGKLGYHLARKMGCKLEAFLSTLCHQKGRPVSRIHSVLITQLCRKRRPFSISNCTRESTLVRNPG